MRYVLKEMTIGEVLDVAINLAKDNFKPLFMITLYMLVPVFFIYQMAVYQCVGNPPGMFAPQQEQQAFLQNFMKNMGPYLAINGVFFFVFGLIVWPITNAALIRAVAGVYLGHPVQGGAAMKEGLSRVFPLLGVTFLVSLATSFGMLLLLVPGIYLAIRLFLSTFSVIIEGTGPSEAMSRSWKLMDGNMGNGFVLGMVVALAAGSVGGMAGLIPQPHIRAALTALLQGASMVGSAATGVVFYFSCRCKLENFDLTVLADAVGKEAPTALPDDANGPGGLSGPSAPGNSPVQG